MKFGVGVIGATGFIGAPYRSEIRQADEDAQIVALCARRQERLEKARREDAADLITQNWREVVEHPQVNLVLILTPDALHHEQALACAENGKHVVCEKPVGKNATQAHEIWTAYKPSKLSHFVPFWTRYVPVFARAREVIQEGQLGDIQAVIYRWHNPRPEAIPFTWRDDAELSAGGSIADVGSHAYDLVRWMTGCEARRVLAHADVISPPKPDVGQIDLSEAIEWGAGHAREKADAVRKGTAPDYANILWEFENGAVGSLVLSHAPVIRKSLSPEVEFHGQEASLAVDRLGGRLTLARSDGTVQSVEQVNDPGFGNRFRQHVFPALRRQINGRTADHPNLYDGWRVQLFTDAAAKSAKDGGWVAIPPAGENGSTRLI